MHTLKKRRKLFCWTMTVHVINMNGPFKEVPGERNFHFFGWESLKRCAASHLCEIVEFVAMAMEEETERGRRALKCEVHCSCHMMPQLLPPQHTCIQYFIMNKINWMLTSMCIFWISIILSEKNIFDKNVSKLLPVSDYIINLVFLNHLSWDTFFLPSIRSWWIKSSHALHFSHWISVSWK